jgi:hypothetical protein
MRNQPRIGRKVPGSMARLGYPMVYRVKWLADGSPLPREADTRYPADHE